MNITINEREYDVISIDKGERDQSGSGFSFHKDFVKEDCKLKEIAELNPGFYKISNEIFEVEEDGYICFMDSWNEKDGPLSHFLINIDGKMQEEQDKYWEDYADAYFGKGECSSCRGGGCIHCEPSRFI
jgi:hypothetical protein